MGELEESFSIFFVLKADEACSFVVGLGFTRTIRTLEKVTACLAQHCILKVTEGLHEVAESGLISVPADISHEKGRITVILCVTGLLLTVLIGSFSFIELFALFFTFLCFGILFLVGTFLKLALTGLFALLSLRL